MNAPTPTTPVTQRNRRKLLLVALVFLAPAIIAVALGELGWRPGTQSFGQPVTPQRNFKSVRVDMAKGGTWAWRAKTPQMTLLALPGTSCAEACLRQLALMRNARVALNTKSGHVRLLYLGSPPTVAGASDVMPAWQIGRDANDALASFRPKGADTVAALLVESNGTALTYYPAGFDANGLLKDLKKVLR
ncbi:hypothetical protein [Oleiagrimonas sp. C23AA]|uniref:hypothetical protein n=1 Tax=Oleiagrimonas sp. C23AA TaxID=2719047 RepID=UPI001423475F|nr:hypothetical protein [Oleiagrimonas sp. C23AA]NII11368.1 hypothetical protein [Oleiagrimonas sp. C23AA]